MFIAIDIGNSTIAFAFMKNGRIERSVRVENEPESKLVEAKLDNFLESVAERYQIAQVMVCGVVPVVQQTLCEKLNRVWGVKPRIVGRDVRVPIVNKYLKPRQVGKDRLVCAFAAYEFYGVPAVVIDSGTAITFDAVSAHGEYLGGAIIPGLRLSASALFEKTALLPRTRLVEPEQVIGRTTEESIQSGLFHGYGAVCDGMIKRLGQSLGCGPKGPKVIMTGGHAEVLVKFMQRKVHVVDPDLIFKGLYALR